MKQLHRVVHWPRRTRVPLRRYFLRREGVVTFPPTKVLNLFSSFALSNARPTRSIKTLACGVGLYVWRLGGGVDGEEQLGVIAGDW